MKKTRRGRLGVLALLTVMLMMLMALPAGVFAAPQAAGSAVVDVEAFAAGRGFALTPRQVALEAGGSLQEVAARAAAAEQKDVFDLSAYGGGSAWHYFVNNVYTADTATAAKDGDVIRVQLFLDGSGSALQAQTSAADKTQLVKALASYSERVDSGTWTPDVLAQKAFDGAVKVMEDSTADQSAVDGARQALTGALPVLDEENNSLTVTEPAGTGDTPDAQTAAAADESLQTAGADDATVVAAFLQQAAACNASATVSFSQLQTLQNAYAALTDTQKALLTDTQKSALSKTLTDAASKALDSVLSEVQTAMYAAQKDISDTGDISDASMVGLVAADKDLTVIGVMDLSETDKARWQTSRDALDALEKTIQTTINNTSSGVTVKGRFLTLPWTVKLTAVKVEITGEQKAALASDAAYKDPTMVSQYRLTLRDFSQAADAAHIPAYDAAGQKIGITLPAFEGYTPVTAGTENLTLITGGVRTGTLDGSGRQLVKYDGTKDAFSFNTTDGMTTFAVVSDSRVPVTAFTLSDTTKTLLLNQTDPSFTLSVKSKTPADTTDLSRLTWTSSDEKVAAVTAEGVVTGKAQGTAVITASVNGLSQTCTVTVKTNAYVDYDSYFSTFRKDNTNMAIVAAALPNGSTEATKNLTAKWINSDINSAAYATVGTPLVVGDNIYVATQNKKLYKLNKSTGAVEDEAALSANVGFFSYATYGDGMIFVPEDGGIVEAFNASTLDSLWRSEAFGGQSNCQLTYANGYIYSGTWSGSTESGTFYCIDATDKGLASQTGNVRKAAWKAADTGGYYWAGAAVVGSNIVFGGDSGTVYVCDQATGAIKSQYATGGAIRASIAYDAATGSIYFTGGDGGGSGMNGITGNPKCYRIAIDASTGQLGAVQTAALPAISTGTPVVYNGRVYVATQLTNGSGFAPDRSTATAIDQSSTANGKLCVIDAASMGLIYNVDLGGPSKASPLLTTAYTGDGKQTVYLYLTVNCHDGAVVRVKDYAGNTTPDSEVIYRPSSDEQEYTTTSLNCDADGVIYYRNDKGHLMALVGTSEGVNDPSKDKGTTGGGSSGSAAGTQNAGSTGGTGKTSGGSAAKTGTASKSASPAATGWSFDTAMSPDGDGSGSAASGQVKQASALLGSCAGGIALVYTLLMAVVRTRKKVL